MLHYRLPLASTTLGKSVSPQGKPLLPQQSQPLFTDLWSVWRRDPAACDRRVQQTRLHKFPAATPWLRFCAMSVPGEGTSVHAVYPAIFVNATRSAFPNKENHASAMSACVCTQIPALRIIFLNSHHQEMPRRRTAKSHRSKKNIWEGRCVGDLPQNRERAQITSARLQFTSLWFE